jgi:hypothetical protein
VYPLAHRAGWLFKAYKPEGVVQPDHLHRLLAMPQQVSAADRRLIETATCWPIAGVCDGSRVCGVVLPQAPARFWCRRRGNGEPRLRTLDLLVYQHSQAADSSPSLPERLDYAIAVARLGELFARLGLVYSDWSYDNTLWAPHGSVYLLDCDALTVGAVAGRALYSNGWDDPLTEAERGADTFTDRFRLGLMIWRILQLNPRHPTGPPWLADQPAAVTDELTDLVAATFATNPNARERRPRPDTWLQALERAKTAATTRTIRTVTAPTVTSTTANGQWPPVGARTTTSTAASTSSPAATGGQRPRRPPPTAARRKRPASAAQGTTPPAGGDGSRWDRVGWLVVAALVVAAVLAVATASSGAEPAGGAALGASAAASWQPRTRPRKGR